MVNFIHDNKDEFIRFRVTNEQKKLVQNMARERNLTVTKFIMELLELENEKKIILNKYGGIKVE